VLNARFTQFVNSHKKMFRAASRVHPSATSEGQRGFRAQAQT
jgi:hypothetical protein